jgi:2-polyprenyl-3-methyl-5-hydroxy-6-metoxy-1,4-benzoquinol methylase
LKSSPASSSETHSSNVGPASDVSGHTAFYSEYQYADLVERSNDLYAAAKYSVIGRYLAPRKRLRILNAGCGSGELSFRLAAAGHEVIGIDPASEYVALAERSAHTIGLSRCSFKVSTIEAFTADEAFDCVVATDVLEHIEDDRTAFDRLVNLAKPGAPVVITVPAMRSLFGFHDEALGHYRRYSKTTLRQLMERRCTMEFVRYFGVSLIPVCLLYSKILRRAYPVAQSGDAQRSPLLAPILQSVLTLESRVPAPLGTSLIAAGISRSR